MVALTLTLTLMLACSRARAPAGGERTHDADNDGWAHPEDCDDTNPSIHPGHPEICDNGVDDNCDDDPWPCALSGALSPDDAVARWAGDSIDAETGSALAGVGDIDGDGISDVAVGARQLDNSAGEVTIWSGQTEGEVSTRDAALHLWGADGDQVGRAIAAAGDLNQDGFADFWVAGLGSNGAGRVWLVHGAPDVDGQIDDVASAMLTPTTAQQGAGLTMTGTDDATGDGVADLLVGLPRAAGAAAGSGAALLLPGPFQDGLSLNDARILSGEQTDDFAGSTVADAGDVNGDGVTDLLIGAWGSDSNGVFSGRVYLCVGPVEADQDLSDAEQVYVGLNEWDVLGFAAAGAGDSNGDGYADMVVGAHGYDHGGLSSGAVWLITSPDATPTLAEAAAEITGEAVDDAVGWSVSGAGDTDGDSYDDVIIGAPGAATAALFLGPVSGRLRLSDADARFVADSSTGKHVSRAGDADGDGLSDILVGAPEANGTAERSGIAWLLLGVGG